MRNRVDKPQKYAGVFKRQSVFMIILKKVKRRLTHQQSTNMFKRHLANKNELCYYANS